jgi:phage/plasmid-associated DNA primase
MDQITPRTTAAIDFITQWHSATTEPAFICSLANDRADSKEPTERHVSTRDAGEVDAFIAKWDRPGRGMFFCVSTIRPGMKRNKENVAEIPGLHADIDFKDVDDDEATILRRVKALPKPPSTIIRSGNGLHLYWKFKEALIINIVDGTETIERVEAALKLLADLVGADMKVTQPSALMRLPGTHNSKRGNWQTVEIESSDGHEYNFDDVETMLSECSPVVLRKLRPSATSGEINPFLAAAKNLGYKPPLDVEKRLAAMMYMGGGDSAIHETQVVVTASMLNAGIELEEVVSLVLEATRGAAGDYGARWNWRREEKAIRGMCATWIKKHPATTSAKPTSSPQPAGASVHSLAEARDRKAEPKPKSQKVIDRENMHAMIGGAVLDVLTKGNTPIMIVVDQLWRYQDDLWIEVDGKGRFHLNRVIETCIRALPDNITSTLKLVAEVRGWLMRNPDIGQDDIKWDDHGKIAITGGLIDIKTLAFEPAKPSHHVTARINCVFDEKAQCPIWLEMLDGTFADRNEVERVATIATIQEILGCALIEDKSKALSRALIFHGISNTGKTDLIKTISGLLTSNPIATPIGTLDGTHGLMEFCRKAPWVLHEAFKSGVWHFSDIVKSILSGDPVQINVKNGALTTQRIRQAIFWGTNYPPQFKEATRAIVNRMIVLTCSVVFDPKVPVGVALAARAAGHAEPSDLILATEKPGLLNWALAGLRRALDRGSFQTTADMDATLETIRTDGNVVASFLDDCVEYSARYRLSTTDFCAAFAVHFEENKEGKSTPSNDSIGRAMVALGDRRIGIDRKVLRDNKHGYYAGIHLNNAGLDYWSAAAGDGLARGKTARLAANVNNVNRMIPPSWEELPVILRLKKHFDSSPDQSPISPESPLDKTPNF